MARHALLIGVSRFRDARLAALNAPDNDVQALAAVLRDPERGGFGSVDVSTDEAFVDLRDRIAALFNGRDPDDLLLLYYSGHGILKTGNDLYLASTETVLDQPQARGIWAGEIRKLMDQTRAARQVLVLDCCHSGAFAPGAKGADATAVTDSTFGDADSTGRYVLTASTAQQFAWDGDRLASGDSAARTLSHFTSWLVDGLGRGEAAPDEPDISMDALFRYLCRRAKAAGSPATPQRFVDRGSEDFVIGRNPAAVGVASVQARAASLADPDWSVRLAAVEALTRLCRRPATRDAAVEALADRLSAERDFKVRAALLKALERPAETVQPPPPAPPPPPPPGPTPPAAPEPATVAQAQAERVALEARAVRNARWLWLAGGGIALVDLALAGAALQLPYGSPVENTPVAYSLVGQFLAALAGLIPNPWNRVVPAPPGVAARVVVVRSQPWVFERRTFRIFCWVMLALAILFIGAIGNLRS